MKVESLIRRNDGSAAIADPPPVIGHSPKTAWASREYPAGKSERETARRLGDQARRAFDRRKRGKPSRPSNKWQKWEIELLGKFPDKEVARQLGRTRSAVKSMRKKLHIPSATPARRWTAAENRLLGTMPDAELARRLKRGVTGVTQQRLKLGISFHLSDAELVRLLGHQGRRVGSYFKQARRLHASNCWQEWEDELLGKMSDRDVAGKTGRTYESVQARRYRLGIQCFPPLRRSKIRPWTDREIKLLGTMNDVRLARRLRRKKHQVLFQRLALKIPPFKPRSPTRSWKPAEIRLLGRFKDSEVARRLGCPQYTVRVKRVKLGITAWRPIPPQRRWTRGELKLLGTVPDHEAARRLNRTRVAVTLMRCRRHIPYPARTVAPKHIWTAREIRMLGRFPDFEVARRLGCPVHIVSHRRLKLGIPAWRYKRESSTASKDAKQAR
jgi:hypothetical protein